MSLAICESFVLANFFQLTTFRNFGLRVNCKKLLLIVYIEFFFFFLRYLGKSDRMFMMLLGIVLPGGVNLLIFLFSLISNEL